MGCKTEFVDDGRGVFTTFYGILTGEEIFADAIESNRDEERTKKFTYSLTDMSGITEFRVTAEEVRLIADYNFKISSLVSRAHVAIVASTPVTYGMARMWQTVAGKTGWNIMVFHSKPEALDWLRKCVLPGADRATMEKHYPALARGMGG